MHVETIKKKISFIIVNYRSADTLNACIRSIIGRIPQEWSYEIILVNNDSNKIAKKVRRSVGCVIELGKNHGYGYANNRGVEVASGEILCLFNPDATFISSSIVEILTCFRDPEVHIVAPQLISRAGTVQEWSVGATVTLQELVRSHIGLAKSKKLWQSDEVTPVSWVSGAAMFIRKDLFKKIQGFDEKFFLYYEDIDLCYRASEEENVRILYCPSVTVRHISGASSDDHKQQKRYYYKSQDYYFTKHFHPAIGIFVRILRVPYRFVK